MARRRGLAYATYAERMRRSIGPKKGRAEGLRAAITVTLTSRFGASGESFLPLLQQIAEPDTLHALFERILKITTLDEACE